MADDIKGLGAVLKALERNTCLTPEDLVPMTGMGRKDVVRAVGKLIGKGYAERKDIGCYTLTAEGEAFRASGQKFKPGTYKRTAKHWRPRPNSMRDRLWAAIRIRQKASMPELIELASRDDKERTKAAYDGAWRYIDTLARVGILRELPTRAPGTALTSNGFKRWQLVTDLGPVAPQIRKNATEVYDPNADQSFPIPTAPLATGRRQRSRATLKSVPVADLDGAA